MQKSKTILAVESSTKACSVALLNNGKSFSRHEILPQKHAHRILPMVEEVLAESGISFAQLDALAFGEGPGAFTGIRIAAGVVQGLALGADKPVIAVSGLLAMAEEYALRWINDEASDETRDFVWASILDARMSEVYLLTGSYSKEQGLLADKTVMLSPQAAKQTLEAFKNKQSKPLIGFGDIAAEYPEVLAVFDEWHDALPNAISISSLANSMLEKEATVAQSIEQSIPTPVYLRNQVADTIAERKLKQAQKQKS